MARHADPETRIDHASHHLEKVMKQLNYINMRQDGETPSIERAVMSAIAEMRATFRELGILPLRGGGSYLKPHAHGHGNRGMGVHRDAAPRRRRRVRRAKTRTR